LCTKKNQFVKLDFVGAATCLHLNLNIPSGSGSQPGGSANLKNKNI